jgi:glycosyltransferase involved in cell wall biosynthesis
MRIAINAADLDHPRIDGTRIYIQNILKNFGLRSHEDQFLIYHKSKFNPELTFPDFDNYLIKKLPFPFYWTQTRFAFEMYKSKPDVLWMPMHSLPYLRSKKTKTVVTIHDLAFKIFAQFFPKKDLRRLNHFTDYAVRNADRLIAVSNSTKNDLLKIYPFLREDKIKVIYHGYDRNRFHPGISSEYIEKNKIKYHIPYTKYFIFLGAIQPRKNIDTLLDAFAILRKDTRYRDVGLVIAGEPGWMYEGVMKKLKKCENVLATGKISPEDKPSLLAGALALVFPSFYEGFGLPALEAMACGTPVVAADNSSLSEIAGETGILFDAYLKENMANSLIKILESDKLRVDLKQKGFKRAQGFSWEKCAEETLEWITKW